MHPAYVDRHVKPLGQFGNNTVFHLPLNVGGIQQNNRRSIEYAEPGKQRDDYVF
jgi:hypothetical protein